MAGLSPKKAQIVQMLVETAPDRVVGGLQNALSMVRGESALGEVRDLVEREVADRLLRNAVFSPVLPLFGGAAGPDQMTFPPKALSLIWRGVKATDPAGVEAAAITLADFQPEETSTEPFDLAVAGALEGLKAGTQRDFAAALEVLDAFGVEARDDLLVCLEISAVVRETAQRLPDWLNRTTEESAAAARVAYKDAVTLVEDSGPRFFQMLSAHLVDRWTILRVISAVMDRPPEQYLADSELAVFALRLMDAIDRGLEQVSTFDLNGGIAVGRGAGLVADVITRQISELEGGIELAKGSGWGSRIQKQKHGLASTVEARLRDVEKVSAAAFPSQSLRVGRSTRNVPRLTEMPDKATSDRATTLLTFVDAIRSSANYGGFASTRTKVVEKLGETIDNYVEEVLAMIRESEAPDPEIARAYLLLAADHSAIIREPRTGDVIRRRATAALGDPLAA